MASTMLCLRNTAAGKVRILILPLYKQKDIGWKFGSFASFFIPNTLVWETWMKILIALSMVMMGENLVGNLNGQF
jgi:hypothetical protein